MKTLNVLNRAYQGLKSWFDPSYESHPYIVDEIPRRSSLSMAEKFHGFGRIGRKKFAYKNY